MVDDALRLDRVAKAWGEPQAFRVSWFTFARGLGVERSELEISVREGGWSSSPSSELAVVAEGGVDETYEVVPKTCLYEL